MIALLFFVVAVVIATVKGVVGETAKISASVNAALDEGAGTLPIDSATLHAVQAAVRDMAPAIAEGFVTRMVSGVGTIIGFVGGSILGVLILYYLLKDGGRIRHGLIGQCAPRTVGP